ncbi:MAG: XRE family transcriptional regulator [Synechococcus sp. MED-G71]|nr:MAG: XRE family transcriptional regulator [Synechococcus sp. MED-G71]
MAWLHSLFHTDLYARLGRSYRQDQPTVKRIARLRAYGMSQMQIARRLGLKPQEVSKAVGQFYA